MAKNSRRLGRPPASSSAETRGRIIDVARRCFAELGYEATTNRTVANEAGITTGAMYHYFDSKLDLYSAVLDEVQNRVYQRFAKAEREADTMVGKLEAVLETAHQLNRDDASLAQFLGASRIDRRRIPELSDALGTGDIRRDGFFEGIVDCGLKTGEVSKGDRAAMISYIRAFTIGLTDGLSNDHREHRQALDGFMFVLRGSVADPKR
ncbi:MAG: TetR/AcrR family transcriptional regulator [Acidimicrobiales bacterium]|jgi:AcrR family transcriptional regulator|nr:TetR/AcrR family transcriptional regulator [Acidimicrobiales bacterium]